MTYLLILTIQVLNQSPTQQKHPKEFKSLRKCEAVAMLMRGQPRIKDAKCEKK